MSKIKVGGTELDRRSKASYRKEQVIDCYLNSDLTMEDVGYIFGVSKQQVWRYLHYDEYLARQRKDTQKYIAKQKEKYPNLYKASIKKSQQTHDEYIGFLVEAKNIFNAKKAFNKAR